MVKIFTIFLVLLFSSCKINPKYSVTGVILDKNQSKRIMTIDHDKIIGFMDPMIMDLKMHDSVQMDNFNVLDSVRFDLVIMEGSHYCINFNVIGQRVVKEDEYDFLNDTDDEIYTKKDIGEIFNDVSFTTIDKEKYTLYKNNKDFTIISYIFSRCPIPEMCPAIISKNIYVADSFKDFDEIEFLLVSFDYKYDTPEVLFENYNEIEKNHSNIKLLSSTGHYNDLILLTNQSDVTFGGVEENNIGHTMRTIILDENKKLIKSYTGFEWTPGDLKTFLLNYMEIKK